MEFEFQYELKSGIAVKIDAYILHPEALPELAYELPKRTIDSTWVVDLAFQVRDEWRAITEQAWQIYTDRTREQSVERRREGVAGDREAS